MQNLNRGAVKDLELIRKYDIQAAEDLGYDKQCIRELKDAKTEGELNRIMMRYRHKKFD